MENQNRASQATVRDLAAVIFRQKWVILTVFGVTTATVFLFNIRSDTTYESAARLQVRRGRVESTQRSDLKVLSWEEEMASELESSKSYPVAQLAQSILDAQYAKGEIEEAFSISRRGIESRVIGESNVLEVSYASTYVPSVQPVTAALAEAYTRFRQSAMEVPGVSEFFARELSRVTAELDSLSRVKQEFLHSVDNEAGRNAKSRLNQLLFKAESSLQDIDARLTKLQRQIAATATIGSSESNPDEDAAWFVELGFNNASTLRNMKMEVMKARLERDELATKLTPKHPDLRAAEETFVSAKAFLTDEITATRGILDDQLQNTLRRRQEVMAEVAGIKERLSLMPETDAFVERLDQEMKVKEETRINLAGREIQSRINTATAPSTTVTLLSPACPPYAKLTRDYVRMTLAPLLSLAVGFLLAFFLDSIDHSVRSRSDVEEHLGLPVLATLPERR